MGYIDEVVTDLSDRQRTILKLRFHLGRGPAEIQRHLGVTERVYQHELERALEHIENERIAAFAAGAPDVGEVAAPSERRPSRAHRLLQRPEPAAACIAAAVAACGGVSHAAVQPAGSDEAPPSAEESPAPEVTLVAHRQHAHRSHRPAGEFGPEGRRPSHRSVPAPTPPEFGPEGRPVATPPAPPTPEELEFGLEGPGR